MNDHNHRIIDILKKRIRGSFFQKDNIFCSKRKKNKKGGCTGNRSTAQPNRQTPQVRETTSANEVIELMELYIYMDFAPLLSICCKYLQDLSIEGETFTPSDVERALWSCAVGAKLSSQKSTRPQK
ncbi:hypothetical protein DVH24_020554 [Malus domestica]|uniref:Uncharacterized protein n=1 Tax=Malus domestica TaxID=3750 RepID=A0A498JDU7_MALDO|nr:hypothetical protein DVH24_020554 [Malus domestica]